MKTRLEPPLDSLDPTDWLMYCDLLQDAGAARRRWVFAQRVGQSLQVEPKLVLVLACAPASLDGHWLRVGRGWFIPARDTSINRYTSGHAWWARAWILRGLARYPYRKDSYGERDVEQLLACATGTPWDHPHPDFRALPAKAGLDAVRATFFRGHALRRMPTAWI